MAGALIRRLSWVVGLVVCLPAWADSRCEALADRIEGQLFERPHDAELIAAWHALTACSDKPSHAPAVQQSLYGLGIWQGFDSNPAFASTTATMELTTPMGLVNLPLQRPDASINTTVQGMAYQKNRWGQQYYLLQLKRFSEAGVDDQWLLSAEQQFDWQAHKVSVAVRSVSAFAMQLRQFHLSDSYAFTPELALTAELRWRRFINAPLLESDLALLGVHYTPKAWPLQLKLAVGVDAALNQRAGGDQQVIEASVVWQQQWQAHQFSAIAFWRQQQDQQGYSEWLANNRLRQLNQQGVLWQWQAPPLWERWYPQLQLEWSEQQANLPLFAWQNTSIRAGFMVYW